jgi:predicted nuclease with TOPRIM domain
MAYPDTLAEAFQRLNDEFQPLQRRLTELEQENERLQRELTSSAEELVLAHADANRQIARDEARLGILVILEKHKGNYKPASHIYQLINNIIKEFQE